MATVLVVDDDAPSREFMRTLLSYRGHRVEQAPDGDRALAMAALCPPDVVITDVLMPGLDGYALARALRGEPATRHIPIVFSTAHYGAQEIQPLAQACGVHDVILKPAQPSMVLATIDSLLVDDQITVSAVEQVVETQRVTGAGTWEFDPATDTIVVSPVLREALGLPSARLTVPELMRRLHPEDAARIASMIERTWYAGAPSSAELRVVDADGAVRELIVSCRPTATSRVWGVAQDVTGIRTRSRADSQAQVDWFAVRRTIDAFHSAVLQPALPAVPGAELAAVYLPAPERLDIGSAWYDARAVDQGRVLLSVGKVAGHDRHPAAVMSHALAALQAYAHDDPDPVGVLTRLNRFLAGTGRDDTFVTAVVALFEPDTGRLRFANGGHPAPVVVAPEGEATAAVLLKAAGPALGVLRDAVFPERELELPVGSAFLAYTDGLTDRHSDPSSVDGKHLLKVAAQAFNRLDPDQPVAEFLAEAIVRDMLGGAAPDDDICLTVLHA
ncbi:SpoIIE family protein phosphatase [Actinoplanes sp. CA-142083]|uniref:SpoIIE family protein phosphatase n=1 Tax=Actinoplanes sp. CA-142083 TaxID=3239903 RepID=UPI003D8EE83E